MYYDLIKFPMQHKNLKWESSEALLDINERPHLFVLITLKGTAFPQRAQIPQVWIGNVFAKYVQVDNEGKFVRAYFDQKLPGSGDIYFGHLWHAELVFKRFDIKKIKTLDHTRLPKNVVMPEYLKK